MDHIPLVLFRETIDPTEARTTTSYYQQCFLLGPGQRSSLSALHNLLRYSFAMINYFEFDNRRTLTGTNV